MVLLAGTGMAYAFNPVTFSSSFSRSFSGMRLPSCTQQLDHHRVSMESRHRRGSMASGDNMSMRSSSDSSPVMVSVFVVLFFILR
jgi:hypothetical protein